MTGFTPRGNDAGTVALLGRSLLLLGLLSAAAQGQPLNVAPTVALESEDFARYDPLALLEPQVVEQGFLSGGKAAGVRSVETGYPTWLEYDFKVPGGVYEVWIIGCLNDSRQAAVVSFDGGRGALVKDERRLQVAGEYTPEARRKVEHTLSPLRAGAVKLPPGEHRLRITHGGQEGYSNSFGWDVVKLYPAPEGARVTIEAGHRPQPAEGTVPDAKQPPWRLRVYTNQGWYAPGEAMSIAATLTNRSQQRVPGASIALELRPLEGGQAAVALARVPFSPVEAGQSFACLREVPVGRTSPGDYALAATVPASGDHPKLEATTSVSIQEYAVPAWVKRARVLWHHGYTSKPPFARSIPALLEDIDRRAAAHANVIILSDCGDFHHGGTPSYPLRRDLRPLVQRCREKNVRYLWYQTAVTAGEYFYYFHPDWTTKPPYYHCGWLSMSPACREWSHFLAADLNALVGRVGLDGIFLDNAASLEWTRHYSFAAEQAVGDHLRIVREGVKQASRSAALVPNFGRPSPVGLRYVSGGWDANLIEGPHPCSLADYETHELRNGRPVRRYTDFLARFRATTGRPVWPLMYCPSRYRKLSIAATAAVGCNPAFGAPEEAISQYYSFLEQYADYLYGSAVFPAPEVQVRLQPDDEDLCVIARQKLHPSGQREFIVHVLNAKMEAEQPVRQEIELTLLSPAPLAPGAFLTTPENPTPRPVKFTLSDGEATIRLRVGVWAMLLLTEELAPAVHASPDCLKTAQGEEANWTFRLTNTNSSTLQALVKLGLPAGLQASPPEVRTELRANANLDLRFRVSAQGAQPGDHDAVLQVEYGGRWAEYPCCVRVREPLELSLDPDHWAIPNERRPETAVVVRNNTRQGLGGALRISMPRGWKVTPSSPGFNLKAGEAKRISLRISMPKVRLANYLDVPDIPIRVSARSNQGRFERQIPWRLHQPNVRVVYSTLGTKPRDALVAYGPSSSLITMVDAVEPAEEPTAYQALDRARAFLDAGEHVTLWLRAAGPAPQLDHADLLGKLKTFVQRGGGLLLQEDLFRQTPRNRVLLQRDFCPIGEPYEASNQTSAWQAASNVHPAWNLFAARVLRENLQLPLGQPMVSAVVKPWATVVAKNESGGPAIVISKDPKRPVAYIAGSLQGEYYQVEHRRGRHETRRDWRYLHSMYSDILRWLALAKFQRG